MTSANSSCPVKDVLVSTTVRMKDAAFPMMDSNLEIEEDMCGFLPEDIEKSESLEQRGLKRSRSHEGIETSQQDENENDIEQIVDRIFAETKTVARSGSLVGSS